MVTQKSTNFLLSLLFKKKTLNNICKDKMSIYDNYIVSRESPNGKLYRFNDYMKNILKAIEIVGDKTVYVVVGNKLNNENKEHLKSLINNGRDICVCVSDEALGNELKRYGTITTIVFDKSYKVKSMIWTDPDTKKKYIQKWYNRESRYLSYLENNYSQVKQLYEFLGYPSNPVLPDETHIVCRVRECPLMEGKCLTEEELLEEINYAFKDCHIM